MLIHCRLNKHPHTILEESNFSFRYMCMSDDMIYIFLEENSKLFANSGDPDQMPHSASDLCLHCLPVTHLGSSRLIWVNMFVYRKAIIRDWKEYSTAS